jgi:hypothetical protein
LFVPGEGVIHTEIALLHDDAVIWKDIEDTERETPIGKMMEYYTSFFFERPHQVYWTVFNDGTLIKMLLPLDKPIQRVNSGGKSTPLGVLVVDKQNPGGKVYEWNENIQYNGFTIFHLTRDRAHAIIRETRGKYSESPAVLIRTGRHTTIGSDGTFENLVLTYDYGQGPKNVLFSCTQHVNLVRDVPGTTLQFEYMIAKQIKGLTFYKITGVDPVTAEEREFSHRAEDRDSWNIDFRKGTWDE